MLGEAFYWILNMSITASVTGLLILLLRQIKRLPRRLTVLLWAIPFLRMVLPFGLNSPYSLMSLLSKFSTKTIVIYQSSDDVAFSMTNSVMAADSYFPLTYKTDLLEQVFQIASVIWLAGISVMLLLLTLSYVTTLSDTKKATHLRDNIYLSEEVNTPAVYGILKPRILLPASWGEEELILLHEQTHIRRRDNLWRFLAFVAVIAHWFNPLCWIFLKAFLTDLELSCDECVLSRLGADRRREYARTLLESRPETRVFTSSFGGAKLRIRIENILSFRKITCLSLVAFLILTAVLFYVLLTNAG